MDTHEEEKEIISAKYAGLEVLCRLLFIASAIEGFTISGIHLGGLADVLLKYVDATKRIEASHSRIEVSALSELKEIQKIVDEGSLGLRGNLGLIRETVKEIDFFLDDELKQIIDLRSYLKKTGAEIIRALAGSDTEAKAQDSDGQKPEAESTVTQ